MKVTEAHRQANKRYDEKNTKQIKLKLNYNTDSDILERLSEVDNMQGYIKQLIRADIKKDRN